MQRSNKYIEGHEMTMAEFVAQALRDELHPKMNMEVKTMGNMRTLAFQVSEELFQKIKDYLQRNNMTQKQFVIGLIENEIERDMTKRADVSEAPTDFEEVAEEHADQQETAAVSDCEDVSGDVEETEDKELDDEEAEDLDDQQDVSEDQGMSMRM